MFIEHLLDPYLDLLRSMCFKIMILKHTLTYGSKEFTSFSLIFMRQLGNKIRFLAFQKEEAITAYQ